MSGIKVVCAAAAVVMAVGHVVDMPRSERMALWASAGHALGVEPEVSAVVPAIASDTGAPSLSHPVVSHMESIDPDQYGQFHGTAEIEGQRFPVMVDTGASMVCLTSEVADRLDYHPSPSDFRYEASTANGIVAYAKIELRELRFGTLVVRDVPAMVAPRGALSRSLLGMNFLTRLSSFRTDGGKLVLQQ